jgi:hypothetical protein
VEISTTVRQFRGHAPRGLREIVVRKDAVGGDDGEAVGSDASFSPQCHQRVQPDAEYCGPGRPVPRLSASPVGVGHRVLLLTVEGTTFVLGSGLEYQEIAKNDPGETGARFARGRRRCALHPHRIDALQDRALTLR